MKDSRGPKPVLSLKKALLKSSSTRSMESVALEYAESEYLVEIVSRLYIADYQTVSRVLPLESIGADVVFNLVSHKCPNVGGPRLTYENYMLCDTTAEDLLGDVDEIVDKIGAHIKNGRTVVVHCFKGISRAPSVAMAYLIRQERLQLELAFDLVKKKSPKVDPNAGFMMQLSTLIA